MPERPKQSPPQLNAPPERRSHAHRGLGVSGGIVIGKALVLDTEYGRVARRSIRPEQVKAELARFEDAVRVSIAELGEVYKKAEKEMGKETAAIFRVHAAMLGDKALIGKMRKLVETELVSAEFALSHTLAELADKFRASRDATFNTKANDIDDLAVRVLHHLVGTGRQRLQHVAPGTIVLARDLTPSQTAAFDRAKVVGFATDLGGRTGHTSIVARALGIPAVVGCQDLTAPADDGDTVILDGEKGIVIVNPTTEQLDEYTGYIEQTRVFRLSLDELSDMPSVTLDGAHVELLGNIEFPEEIPSIFDHGGEGVGLYRTEYLYLARDMEPTEKDHFNAYRKCVELCRGKPLTIRTVDLGADKYTQSRTDIPERNPFLGCRSIRYCLRSLPMFRRQLKAIVRASAFGPIRVMFPLVTTTSEFRSAKFHVMEAMEDLAEDGVPYDPKIKLGMMVEVPSAAIMADTFAREVDFFSIGTNDLVQYTLAVDRTNERIANLYNPAHPAVIKLIRDVARVARHRKIPVSCCGESAAELEYAMLLIGLGLRTLSVTASSIPRLKRMIRSVTVAQCERVAKQALSLDSDVQVSSLLRDRARKIVPEAFDGRAAD